MEAEKTRAEIERLVKKYYQEIGKQDLLPVRYASSLHDENEAIEMINAVLDGWWVNGERTSRFEQLFSKYLNVKHSMLAGSGSSALMLAFDALNLEKGSKIVSPALTFPTTINPAIRQGMDVTLVDSDIATYNINVDELEKAITKDTRALILPYIMGNMSDMARILDLVEDRNILLLEDCCEALGSKYGSRTLGTLGTCSAFSFFPSHHISAGGGGIFTTNDNDIFLRALSLKNWGRQYSKQEHIPNQKIIRSDYVQQYTYETIGYNLNANELMAAKGLIQMGKLDKFNESREKNFQILLNFFKKYEDIFILPETVKNAKPSWFAFPITIRQDNAKFTREQLMAFLFNKKIETRYILCGNIARQPAYKNIAFRTAGSLKNADYVYNNSFFIGVYHGIDTARMKYIQESFEEFLSG
jgi:CDP-4-dehydro-6-deoxyglucose reductase, E1